MLDSGCFYIRSCVASEEDKTRWLALAFFGMGVVQCCGQLIKGMFVATKFKFMLVSVFLCVNLFCL